MSADALASQLASALTISHKPSKGKEKASEAPWNPEERCLAAMRAVNSASKRLSSIISAGWKATDAPSKKSEHSIEGVRAVIEEARLNLNLLREMKKGDLDVERAASSIIGKVLSLELVRLSHQYRFVLGIKVLQ